MTGTRCPKGLKARGCGIEGVLGELPPKQRSFCWEPLRGRHLAPEKVMDLGQMGDRGKGYNGEQEAMCPLGRDMVVCKYLENWV